MILLRQYRIILAAGVVPKPLGGNCAVLPFGSGRYSPLSARFTQAPLLYKFTVAQFVVFYKAFASFFAKPLDSKPGFHAMLETAERQK